MNKNNIDNILNNKTSTDNEKIQSMKLVQMGYHIQSKQDKYKLFERAVFLHPRNGHALLQLGLLAISHPGKHIQCIGCKVLERALDKDYAIPFISIDSNQGYFLTIYLGRIYTQHKLYERAKLLFTLASNSTTKMDQVADIQKATLITGYPKSVSDANTIVHNYCSQIDALLKLDSIDISSALNDHNPYSFCMLSAFNIETYYEGDFREMMSKNYQLIVKTFPDLMYVSPYIDTHIQPRGRIKIGIASGFFYDNNSVLADFQGVMDRLSRTTFEITYIYLKENSLSNSTYLSNKEDRCIIIESNTNPNWLDDARETIGSLQLDLILYLDSTMSPICHKTLMSKLAPIQAVSHGHPVTSGVNRAYMDYYISWGAAELEYDEAQTHYTEKLLLLPADKMHQYNTPRITKNGLSAINNLPFAHLTRLDFSDYIPADGNWYTCMQKPFKRHPEFDEMMAGVLHNDKNGRLILHDCDNDESKTIIINRLLLLHVDMSRVHFIPVQPHNVLMALYKVSDVILDSYYAGGCTTTREALEIGCPVVTLPAKYLGGRWSLAYYNIMGVHDLIAKNKEDYINIAVKVCTNTVFRANITQQILDTVHTLFCKEDAVESWSNAIKHMITSKVT